MGEVGCSKDGSFQNLEVNGFASINNTKTMNQQKVIYATVPVKTSGSAATEDEKIFWLPPRSIITAIDIVCIKVVGFVGAGNITIVVNHQQGQTVAQSDNGDSILLATAAGNVPAADGVIAHTPAGIFHSCTLVSDKTGGDPPIIRRSNVGPAPKAIYLRVINTHAVDVAGTFAWIVSYKQF